MNTYNDNLRTSVDETLVALAAEQDKINSEQTSAQYSLYYAQGAQITAQNKQAEVVKEYACAGRIDNAATHTENISINLLATAKDTEKNVASMVTDASTAANNMQVAANAVAKLSADIGSAFNIVSASDFGTDIYKMTQDANHYIRQTSLHTESVSKMAMDASTASAEIIAKVVSEATSEAKSEVDNLVKATESEFIKLGSLRTDGQQKVSLASKTEKAAEGVLQDSNCELVAINSAYDYSNQKLNFNASVTVCSTSSFTFYFDAYKQPFLNSSGATSIPDAVNNYYIILVKQSKKNLFNLSQAETTFTENKSNCYRQVSAGKEASIDIIGLSDSDNDVIIAGTDYVAFLYIELNFDYKKMLNNFSDMLSTATLSFTLVDKLPVPGDISVIENQVNGNVKKLGFSVAGEVKHGTEYRCIFLPENLPGLEVFMTDSKNDPPGKGSHLGFYFNLTIAEQISAGNYTVAKAEAVKVDETAESSQMSTDYQVALSLDTTDNFGNVIMAGRAYFAVILAVMDKDSQYARQYTSALSNLSSPITVIADQ
ncbi:MAG: hypothetical protein KUG80_02420 [Gammaproteobacteria bacterium]|nr:hypothetical protein [Gammaproteobacteria bacterium]